MERARLASLYVWLVALHSIGVGVALVFFTEQGLELGGYEAESLFFARQGGVFHFLVAAVYLVEHRRYGSMDFMVLAKATAVVFLVTSVALGAPWAAAAAALGDALMLGGALVARRWL